MNMIPELKTAHFTLRKIAAGDIEALHRYWSDEEVTRYMSVCFQSVAESQQMVELLNSLPETGEGMRWAIVDNNNGLVLGSCGYHNLKAEHRKAEVGYELGREYWGQGVIQEAMTAVLGYCFETLGLNRIEALVTEGNIRSINALKKLGFKAEGLLRDYEFAQGHFQNQVVLSILRGDWMS